MTEKTTMTLRKQCMDLHIVMAPVVIDFDILEAIGSDYDNPLKYLFHIVQLNYLLKYHNEHIFHHKLKSYNIYNNIHLDHDLIYHIVHQFREYLDLRIIIKKMMI